jgi:NADPH2:quinone reductase
MKAHTMTPSIPHTALQLRSLIRSTGELEVSLVEVEVPQPAADEVLVRMEATPINPSDLGLLFGAADMSTARAGGSAERPVIHAQVPERAMKAMAGRFDQSLPVGNEGAGTVVQAGSAPAAQALLGKKVALMGGAMYTQYRSSPPSSACGCPTTPRLRKVPVASSTRSPRWAWWRR